jgi:HEAT repeat protein
MLDERLRDRLNSLIERAAPLASGGNGLPSDRAPGSERLGELELTAIAGDESIAPTRRIEAIAALLARQRNDKPYIEFLVEASIDPDDAIALAAIRAIPAFSTKGADGLLALCRTDREALRNEAARLLARRKERRLVPILNAWLAGPDPQLRELAIDCLGWVLNPRDAIVVLERLLGLGILNSAETEAVGHRVAVLRAGWLDEPPAADAEPIDS